MCVRVCVYVLVCMLSVCSGLICPDGGMCEDGNTCCQTPGSGYGCCPLPNAECCSDHLHCCYEGTLCDMEHGTCANKTHILGWVRRVSAKQTTRVQAVVCPDQKSECPDDTTCCQMPDGAWGCCPMPNAVCCDDKRHCCPQGTTCDLPHSKCVSPLQGFISLLQKFPATRKDSVENEISMKFPDSNDVICPDKVSTCPDDTTCCKLANGSYGCCPMPNAVCCDDHIHCCPEGTTCDLEHDKCVMTNELKEMTTGATPIILIKPADSVPCNDSVACATGSTCCKTPDGEWACCPLQQAVCCEDHIHCCPHDTVCNIAAGTCDGISNASGRLTVPWKRKTPAVALLPESDRCDETSVCPTGTTCCKQKSGSWACCLLPQAVCCEDHEHCCPQGYKCDVAHESCEHPFLPSMPWIRNHPALSVTHSFGAIVESGSRQKCDAQTSCPRGSTCCYMAKLSKWGCCPLPQAVCCGDGDHCCPNGYTCDQEKPICVKGILQIPWFEKQPALSATRSEVPDSVGDVKCDDTTSCAAGTTCCRLRTGEWGCCPLVQAVCCEDHEHCCPHDYTCDLSSGTCIKPVSALAIALTLVHPVSDENDDEVMCDDSRRCSKSQTCCRVSDTEWACCPFKQAMCCKDAQHCCPNGYTCHPEKRCTKASLPTWWDNTL